MKLWATAVALLSAQRIIDAMARTLAWRLFSFAFALLPWLNHLHAQEAGPEAGTETIKAFHFEGTTLGGRHLDQDDFKDCAVLVDLWGTWCGPCRQAVPSLVQLHQKYKHRGLEIVAFCYSAAGGADNTDKVRAFAAENRITYDLLPGDSAVRDQVPGFSGYPTMLLFERGWKHSATHVGWGPEMAAELEKWLEKTLSDGKSGGEKTADDETKDDTEPEAPEEVPAGRFFLPGKGNRDVELEFEDAQCQRGSLADLRGKPLLLALTTTWDRESERTARLLQALHTEFPQVGVVAWHLEKPPDAAAKVAAVHAFKQRLSLTYRAFTTDLQSARQKVHKFAAFPTLLLIDANGVLVEREGGISDEIEQRIRTRLTELTKPQ